MSEQDLEELEEVEEWLSLQAYLSFLEQQEEAELSWCVCDPARLPALAAPLTALSRHLCLFTLARCVGCLGVTRKGSLCPVRLPSLGGGGGGSRTTCF